MLKAVIFDWGRTLYDRDNEKLFPETKGVLEKLSKKYSLAIVSLARDGNFESRSRTIKENDLEKYFVSILFTKEDKSPLYVETIKKLRVAPHETAIVDDRMIRGVAWGNANGAKTIWLKKGKFSGELPNSETGEPTHIIEGLEQVLNIL